MRDSWVRIDLRRPRALGSAAILLAAVFLAAAPRAAAPQPMPPLPAAPRRATPFPAAPSPALPLQAAPLQTAAGPVPVATFTVFGPETFVRRGGRDHDEFVRTFRVNEPTATIYRLHVDNGASGERFRRVTGAAVQLDGVPIFRPRNFGEQIATLEKIVVVRPSSRLVVDLRGEPGSGLTVTVFGISVPDDRPPTIRAAASPLPNEAGWNDSDVLVTFSCADPGSGIRSCPEPILVAKEGRFLTASGTAFDNAGNHDLDTVSLMIDKTPPTILASAAPGANRDGWNNGDVTVSFLCSDELSGVDSCPGPVVVAAEGAHQVITATVADVAGNRSEAGVTLNLDRSAPTIAIFSPPPGSTEPEGTVEISGSITDPLSGVAAAACSGSMTLNEGGGFRCGVPTPRRGQAFTVEISATDKAGNSATASVGFSVQEPNPPQAAARVPLPAPDPTPAPGAAGSRRGRGAPRRW